MELRVRQVVARDKKNKMFFVRHPYREEGNLNTEHLKIRIELGVWILEEGYSRCQLNGELRKLKHLLKKSAWNDEAR